MSSVYKIRNIRLSNFHLLIATVSLTLLLSGCTTDGGISSGATQTKTSAQNGNTVNTDNGTAASGDTLGVKVSGPINKAPIMSVPVGTSTKSLQVSDIVNGNGTAVTAGSTLTVHYTLYAGSTGKLVESSWNSGQPATFSLSQVIPGWQQGMLGMKTGGRRLLIIPPDLGYGANGSGPIGKNETLVFVVDLVSVA